MVSNEATARSAAITTSLLDPLVPSHTCTHLLQLDLNSCFHFEAFPLLLLRSTRLLLTYAGSLPATLQFLHLAIVLALSFQCIGYPLDLFCGLSLLLCVFSHLLFSAALFILRGLFVALELLPNIIVNTGIPRDAVLCALLRFFLANVRWFCFCARRSIR